MRLRYASPPVLALVAALLLGACTGPGGSRTPDERYGHRYGDVAPDGRETVLVAVSDTAASYVILPAVVDSVVVRPAREEAPEGEPVAVEALVKGVLPDACTALDVAVQERTGHIIDVSLMMRQPHGALCAQVVRPFRFYLPLEGGYPPGSYTLLVNGTAYPFRIRATGG